MSGTGSLSIREAAEQLGVHYMTVYRYIRLGMLPARQEGATWKIEPDDLRRLAATPSAPARKRPAPWRRRLRARMLAGDEVGSWGVVEAALAAGMGPGDFYVEVLTPALHSIGKLWETGEVGVEDEHLASNIAAALIGRLGPRFSSRGRKKGTVVIALPEGERHDLGAAMLADILRSEGYRVLNLGADTPSSAMSSILPDVDDLSAVMVGLVNSERFDAAVDLVSAIRSVRGEVPVVTGGAGISDAGAARRLGADGWADDARQVGQIIAALVEGSTGKRRSSRLDSQDRRLENQEGETQVQQGVGDHQIGQDGGTHMDDPSEPQGEGQEHQKTPHQVPTVEEQG
jgi:excisionase family DNA binding protein